MFQNYNKIGKTKPSDKFIRELKKYKTYSWDTQDKNRKLIEGAAQAFQEGRPQNIQAALSNAEGLNGYRWDIAATILFEVAEKSDDKLAAIELALKYVPEAGRKKLLSESLSSAIAAHIGGEPFYDLLIKSGANANAVIDGYPSIPLVTATIAKSPFSVIEFLHKNGASFSNAITTMHSKGRTLEEINRLEHYKQKLEGNNNPAPAVAEGDAKGDEDIRQSLRDIKQQLQTLTEAFNAMQSRAQPEETQDPASRRKPQQKPPYPSVG